jgi:hypothetical protein
MIFIQMTLNDDLRSKIWNDSWSRNEICEMESILCKFVTKGVLGSTPPCKNQLHSTSSRLYELHSTSSREQNIELMLLD